MEIELEKSMTQVLDTLVSSQKLKEVGFTDDQAKMIIDIISAAVRDNVATKTDLDVLKRAVKFDIEKLDAKLESETTSIRKDIALSEQRLTTKIYTAMIGAVGLLAAFMKFFD